MSVVKINVSAALRNRCVLATLSGSYYHSLRRDTLASSELAKLKGIDSSAFQTFKNIFLGADKTLQEIRAVVNKARNFHIEITSASPWRDARLLPNVDIERYRETVLGYDLELDKLLTKLKLEWPEMLITAEQALGPAYVAEAYPTLQTVLDSCSLTYSIQPIPDEGGFLLDAFDPKIAAELKAALTAEVTTAGQILVSQLGDQLMTILENAHANLSKNKETGGNYRTEWHKNLAEFLPRIKGFLGDDNPAILALTRRIENFLIGAPEYYRENLPARESAKDEVESIIDTFGSMFGKEAE